MTLSARSRTADEMPPVAPAPADDSVEAILSDELKDLRGEIEALVQHGLSDEEAQGLLDWAKELEGKIRAVASVLRDPSPANVSAYLRFVAAGVGSTKSRRFATSSLRLLGAALARSSR